MPISAHFALSLDTMAPNSWRYSEALDSSVPRWREPDREGAWRHENTVAPDEKMKPQLLTCRLPACLPALSV